MYLSGCFILILLVLIGIDFYINRDILSPIMVAYSSIISAYMLPSFFEMVLGKSVSYIPATENHLTVMLYANTYLFSIAFSFGIFYLISLKLFRNYRLPEFEIAFRTKGAFLLQQVLAFSSTFVLLVLVIYNFWGNGAYYFMSGYGAIRWVSTILLFVPSFLFLAVKKHRGWVYFAFILNIFLTGVLLNRATQTFYLLLSGFIILRETFAINWKKQLFLFLVLPIFFIVPKFYFASLESGKSFEDTIIAFITYDLGRFDYFATAVYYKLNGLDLDSFTLLRYVPLANYLPYVQDLNQTFQELPEKLFLGSRVSIQGGLPFTLLGEMHLLIPVVGMLVLNAMWGIFFGFLYALIQKSKNPYLLGIYGYLVYLCNSLALTILNALFPLLVFLSLFCIIRVSKDEQ